MIYLDNQFLPKPPLSNNLTSGILSYSSKTATKENIFFANGTHASKISASQTGYLPSDSPLDLFVQCLQKEKLNRRTIKAYSVDVNGFLSDLRAGTRTPDLSMLGGILPNDVKAYLLHLGQQKFRHTTIKRKLAALRRFFSFLVQNGFLTASPLAGISIAREDRDVIPIENLITIFSYYAHERQKKDTTTSTRLLRDEVIVLFLLFLGIRQYHLVRLRLSHIKRDGQQLVLNSPNGAAVHLHGIILSKLHSYVAQRRSTSDTLFLEPNGPKAVTLSSLHSIMTELSCILQIKCTPRSLYHTFLHLQSNPEEEQRVLAEISLLEHPRAQVGGPDASHS